MTDYSIMLLPGDGIGTEVMAQAERVIDWLNTNANITLSTQTDYVGGAAYDHYGDPFADETYDKIKTCDAVLFGAIGGPQWDDTPYDKRPEAGLLKMRKQLGLFANLRPAIVFDALAEASSLKADLVAGLDILIVRELTGGIYFGEPRGIETCDDGQQRAVDTQVYTTHEIKRITKVAFDLAMKRNGRVTSVDKANVMASGRLWRDTVNDIHASDAPGITLDHLYVDNCAMQLVRAPKQFDVIVTDNLFGDILSDCAAMLTGSLGMLPSASLGDGSLPGVFEPVHGSAPDIAGQGKANPLAMILSLAMALRYALGRSDLADQVEAAVKIALENGARTADLGGSMSTDAMGSAVLSALSMIEENKAA